MRNSFRARTATLQHLYQGLKHGPRLQHEKYTVADSVVERDCMTNPPIGRGGALAAGNFAKPFNAST
jgi:hypothetical protein